jgi:hypothetical protein
VTSDGKKRLHSRALRTFRAALVAFVSLWALYIVGINVFLSTSLFERVLDGDPQTIDIHYRRGWSVIPGRIHAEGLSIRGRDSHVEWILKLDRAEFDMSFLALTRTRFDVSRVHGHGISFRLRNRLDAPPTTPLEIAQAADLPSIDGLAPWSVRPASTNTSDVWSNAAYHLWTAHLENIVADDIREIWIDRGHFEGDARIDGRFYFKPLRKVDVGPTLVTIRSGRIHVGPFPIAEGLVGTVDAKVVPFDPRTAETAELLHGISASTELRAHCPDLGAVPYTLAGGTRITGPFEVRALSLRIESGVLANGTRIDLALPAARIEKQAQRLGGTVVATAEVEGGRFASRVEAAALVVSQSDALLATAPIAIVTADSRALDLAEPFGDLHVVVDIPRADLPDARPLEVYAPRGPSFAILAGSARGSTHVEAWLAEKRAAGRFTLRGDDVVLRLAKLRVRGQTTAAGSFASYRWDTGHVEDLSVGVDVPNGVLAYEREPLRALVDVAGLRLDAHAADIVVDDPLRTLEAQVVIPEGSIVEPGLLASYLPQGSDFRIRGGHGRFALDAQLDVVDHLARGTVDLHSKDLGFTFRDLVVTTALGARAQVHDWRWEQGDLALDRASVDVTNVVMTRAGRRGFTIRRMFVTAQSPRFDLTDPLAAVSFTANVEGADVRDATMINAFLPSSATIRFDAENGLFAAIATADVRHHVARAKLAASASGMGITDGKGRLLGDMAVQAAVSDWDLAKSTMTVGGVRVALTNVKGRLAPDRDTEVSAKRIEILAATPRLAIGKPTVRDLDAELVIEGAEIPDARALRAFIPEGSLFQIESGSARLSANLRIASTTATAKGQIELALSHAGIALDKTHLAGDFRIVANVSRFDPELATLDLGGSRVEMRNVSATGVSTPTTGWSGDLVFDQGSLTFAPKTIIDAGFRLEARDANPLFALVFKNDMPGVLEGRTSMDHLSASGRVTADANGLFLDELDARGGNMRAHGSYASEGGERRGAFIVEKGPFAVGIRLEPAVTLRFFALRGWLEGERKLVEKIRLDPSRKAKVGP